MKRKAVLCMVLGSALVLLLAGQTTKIITPGQRPDLTKAALLKIEFAAAWETNGDFSAWAVLSQSGHPLSGATVKIGGSQAFPEKQPGYYEASWNMPVNAGQSIVLTVSDSMGVTRTATATIHNVVKIFRPWNGEAINRAQVSAIPIRWGFAAASVPVYLYVKSPGTTFYFAQKDVAGGQFSLPLVSIPAGLSELWIHLNLPGEDFTFSGLVAAGSKGSVQQADTVRVILK